MAIQNALPKIANGVGIRTNYATLLPPGSKVAAYVGANQDDSLDAYSASTLLVPTLQAGLARCRANKGDVVAVLPGHTENVSSADFFTNLVAGTQIIGMAPLGSGLMPSLVYTATTATFLLDVANVTLAGIAFSSSLDAVANYVTVSAARSRIQGCQFFAGFSSGTDMAVPLIIASGSDDSTVEDNTFVSIGGAINTSMIQMSGTNVHVFNIRNNYLHGSCPTAGMIDLSGSGVGWRINDNVIFNTSATTPRGIRHADTALSGLIYNNLFGFITDVTVLTEAISAAGVATANVRSVNNFGIDEDSLGGIQVPTGTGVE